MKRRFMRLAALGMTVVTACSVTGCGKGESGSKENSDDKEAKSEYGYLVDYVDVVNSENAEFYTLAMDGDNIYYSGATSNEDWTTGEVYIKQFNIASPDEQKTIVSYDFTEDSYIYIPYVQVKEDGSLLFIRREYDYSDMDVTGEMSETVPELEGLTGEETITEEYLELLGIDLEEFGLVFDDVKELTVGEVVDMYDALTSDGDSGEEYYYDDNGKTYLVTVDAEGKETSSKDVSEAMKDCYPYSYMLGKDGKIYMQTEVIIGADMDTWEMCMFSLDTESGEVEQYTVGTSEVLGMTATGDGQIVVAKYDDEGEVCIDTWDMEKNKLSGKNEDKLDVMWMESMYAGEGDTFFYSVDNTLYTYDLSEQKNTKLFKLVDWNITADNVSWIGGTEENLIVLTEMYGSSNWAVTLNLMTRVKAADIPEKTEITLGCLYAADTITNAVVEFNKKSQNYKVVIKEYLTDDVEYDAGIAEFNNDILSGNGPDLIDLSSLDISSYAGKGLFEDLYTYIENDAEFSKKNLNESVLKLFESDGKLMAMPSTFSVQMLVSDKSLYGDSALTLDKFAEIVKANPDKEIVDLTGRESMLANLYVCNSDYFVNMADKTCNFTDGTFEKLLNICKDLPSDEELWEQMDGEYEESEPEKVSKGTLLFYNLSLYSPEEYQIAGLLFKNGYNMSGYPSVEGGEVTANVYSDLMAISSNSKYKEDCWEIVKTIFESADDMFNIPVDNDALDKMLEEACTPNMEVDDNGNEVEMPSVYGWGDNFELEIYAMTEAEAEAMKTLVNSVTTLVSSTYNEDVYNIIMEESEAFFEGDATASEVCEIIQSRVNIFINEDN